MAERVFADKIEKVGFVDLEVIDRQPFGLEDAARYPLFTPDLIELMDELLPEQQRDAVAVSVTLVARKPDREERTAP